MFKKIDREKLYTGLVGIIAFVAIVFEVVFSNFDKSSIAGAIKDFSGIIIDVAMLFVAFNIFKPKKKVAEDFEGAFKEEMTNVITKYNPLIETNEKNGRYMIADNMAVLYEDITCKYDRLFDFDFSKQTIEFFVHKKLFMGKSKNDFSERQSNIIKDITNKIKQDFDIIDKKHTLITDGFRLYFKENLSTKEDAKIVVDIIDKIIFLYIVEYKK